MTFRNMRSTGVTLILLALLSPLAANAHHAMDNAIPATLISGLISGLAHPIIGLDHFLFVIAIGGFNLFTDRKVFDSASFIVATVAGGFLHLTGFFLPYGEVWIAISLIIFGFFIYRNNSLPNKKLIHSFFVLAGVLHGYAYGEAILGAEATPLLAYIFGFSMIQLAIVFIAYRIMAYCAEKKLAIQAMKMLSGALCVFGGFFLILPFA